MEKWKEEEIATIGYMQIQGPMIEAMMQKFMRNQNDLIDIANRHEGWIERVELGITTRAALNRSEKIGGHER